MIKNRISDFQIRYTVFDTLNYQYKIKIKLKNLIHENKNIKLGFDNLEFCQMVAKSCLSQGVYEPFSFVLENGYFLFPSVQNYAFRLADLYSSRIKLTTKRPENIEIIVPISKLWQILYDKLLVVFPTAIAEAYHMSAEVKGTASVTSIPFTSKTEFRK